MTPKDQIKALQEALEPFAKAAELADKHAKDSERLGMGRVSDLASPGWKITYGHVKKARAVLAETLSAKA